MSENNEMSLELAVSNERDDAELPLSPRYEYDVEADQKIIVVGSMFLAGFFFSSAFDFISVRTQHFCYEEKLRLPLATILVSLLIFF